MSFVIISFYTKNTKYYEESLVLEKSITKLNIPYKIYPVDSLKDWSKNCQQKSKVILQSFSEFPSQNIVYTDADSIIHSYPTLFDNIQEDIAYHYLPWRNEILSGTVLFKNNDKCKELVQRWIRLNDTNKEWDQRNFQSVLDQSFDLDISTRILPVEYCYIFDNVKQKALLKGEPVIEHYQASRRLKWEVSK
jgi:5'(3')-deoxyribonucleotidase